ncbi:MAG: ABC transporter ATP-binding protein [Thermodesulfovibrionales bacterium]|nr:ABC transporter ATP-binding protein [Thermodesulfovibrionales bacterium]
MLEKIRDLTCGYDSGFLLQDINFEVKHKELIGIIGPNGSGKTTLLRAITRLLRPKKGEIFFEGKDIWQIPLKEFFKKIAVVTQNPPVNSMSVEEFVLLGRIPHYKRFQFFETREDLEVSRRCMALTNTLRLKDKSINQLSGGERQLVSIARALTQDPKLLLLDEPTAHLDITHQVGILDLIKRLNKEFGLTVIMVLHDLNLASEYCDRLLLLNNGKMHKTGTPQEVLTYQVIEEIYNTIVIVKENPVSLKPYIFLVPEEERQKGITGRRGIEY